MTTSRYRRPSRNPHPKASPGPRRPRHRLRPGIERFEDRALLSTLTVRNTNDSGAGSLRAAIAAAHSGDTIIFAPSVWDKTITLTSGELPVTKSLDIEGPGAARLTVSGDHARRAFHVGGGATVTIAGLTIADGSDSSVEGGGGVLNEGSTLTLANDVVADNEALGPAGETSIAAGGAVSNVGGTLTVTGSTFVGNRSFGGDHGGAATGGAIGSVPSDSASPTLTITRSTFLDNEARGGDGGVNVENGLFMGCAFGGAVYNFGGTLRVTRSTFTGNQAVAGNGGTGGSGAYFTDYAGGGALLNDVGGSLVLDGCTFTHNRARGGSDATGGTGTGFLGGGVGGALGGINSLVVTNSTFDSNEALGGSNDKNTNGAPGSDAGSGYGGAIEVDGGAALGLSTTATLSNLTVTRNRAVGGAGNTGSSHTLVGAGTGGGLALLDGGTGTLDIRNSLIALNQALGGQGGDASDGGDGRGGGLATVDGGNLLVSAVILTFNEAGGGQGGKGGDGLGGGIYTQSSALGVASLTVTRSAIVVNQADGGTGGTGGGDGQGIGGGVYISPGGTPSFDAFTIIAHNHASTSHDNIYP